MSKGYLKVEFEGQQKNRIFHTLETVKGLKAYLLPLEQERLDTVIAQALAYMKSDGTRNQTITFLVDDAVRCRVYKLCSDKWDTVYWPQMNVIMPYSDVPQNKKTIKELVAFALKQETEDEQQAFPITNEELKGT